MPPIVHREGPFRFFFYSYEPREPPHVHVERDDAIADPGGLPPRDLQHIAVIVRTHRDSFLEVWHEYFGEP